METSSTIWGRLSERIIGWIALAGIVAAGIAIWQMDAQTRWAIWQTIWKTIVWLVVAAALPWSGRLFIGRLLELSTNWAGVGLIAGFTLVNAVFGMILLGGFPSGGWGWLAALAALSVVGTYNFLVAEYLAEQAGV